MTATPAPKISEVLSEDIQAAVEKTFLQMFALEVKPTFKVVETEYESTGDVSGAIDLIQGGPQGVMVLSFPQATLFAVLKTFYKRDFTELDNVAASAVGEVINIIFGVFKYRVSKKGFAYATALPKIATGAKHKVSKSKWTLIGEFSSNLGPFTVHLTRNPDIN